MITTSLVGLTVSDITRDIDERWTMAYAAALDDHLPAYFDTTTEDGVVAHPLFAVCAEWPVIVASREASLAHGLTEAEVLTSVHATHDTVIHRLIRPGDRLSTSLEMVGMTRITPGVKSTIRLTTVDQHGQLVATTTQDGIYLGQAAEGQDQPDPDPPSSVAVERIGSPTEVPVPISAGAAHTYTECARIWNPIHTDKAVALQSGLPDIILHGTANLAHGISVVVAAHADGNPQGVRRVVGRFAAMVRLPSQIMVRFWDSVSSEDGLLAVPFEVINQDGAAAVKDGVVLIDPNVP